MENNENRSDVQSALNTAIEAMNINAASDIPVVTGLKETLSLKTDEKLRLMAKVFGVAEYESMEKEELLDKISEKLKNPEFTASILSESDESEFRLFKEAVNNGGYSFPVTQQVPFQPLQAIGLVCAFLKDDTITVIVPDEISAVWQEIEKSSFLADKLNGDVIHRYALAAMNLYGEMKLEALIKIIEKYEDITLDADTVKIALLTHIRRDKPYYLWTEYVVNEAFGSDLDGLEELISASSDIPRYLPEKDEFLKYASTVYYEKIKQYDNLKAFIEKATGDPHVAGLLTGELRLNMASGATEDDCILLLKSCEIQFDDTTTPPWKLTILLKNAKQYTRLWKYRGHTQEEYDALPKPERNGKCPCGLGLKYKKCCAGK